jgi:hypothetical protein
MMVWAKLVLFVVHYKQYQFCPRKNGNLSGGKYINFPEYFLQNDSGVKIRLK